MSEYIETKLEGFVLKKAETEEDINIVYDLICKLAEYENMENDIHGDAKTLYRSVIEEKMAQAVIAYENEIPVGFMVYFYNFSTFDCRPGIHLEDLFIYKDYRGKGYGKTMITFLANEAVTRGFTRLEWACLNWNKPSIDFYESIGARNLCEWRTYRLSGKELANCANYYFENCAKRQKRQGDY